MPRPGQRIERQITGFAATRPGDFPIVGKSIALFRKSAKSAAGNRETIWKTEGTVFAQKARILGHTAKRRSI